MAALRAAASSRIAYIDRPAPPPGTAACDWCRGIHGRPTFHNASLTFRIDNDHEWATDEGVITKNNAGGMDSGTREAVFFSHACQADNVQFLYHLRRDLSLIHISEPTRPY